MANKEKVFTVSFIVVSVVVAVFILEVLSGIIFDKLPKKFNNGKRIVQIFLRQPPKVPASIAPHPYMLYQNTKSFSSDGFLQHNANGYRGGEFTLEKSGVSTRMVALGGSTTYMYPYIKNPGHTWVAQLEKRLREEIDPEIQVINAGQTYATTAEMLTSYVFRHRHLNPDILIIEAGGNDIVPLMFEGYDPEYTHFRAAGQGRNPRPYERTLLKLSRFFRLVYVFWLNPVETVYQSQPYAFNELDPQQALARVMANPSEGFKRNLEALIAYAQADGVQVVLLGFLQARREFLAKGRDDFKGFEDAWILGLEKHHRIMEELSSKYKVPFIKLEQDLFEDSWFQDNCHLNEEGETVKADLMRDFFIQHKNQFFKSKEKVEVHL